MYFNEINEKRLTIFEQKEKKNYFINNKREKSFKKPLQNVQREFTKKRYE